MDVGLFIAATVIALLCAGFCFYQATIEEDGLKKRTGLAASFLGLLGVIVAGIIGVRSIYASRDADQRLADTRSALEAALQRADALDQRLGPRTLGESQFKKFIERLESISGKIKVQIELVSLDEESRALYLQLDEAFRKAKWDVELTMPDAYEFPITNIAVFTARYGQRTKVHTAVDAIESLLTEFGIRVSDRVRVHRGVPWGIARIVIGQKELVAPGLRPDTPGD